MYKSIYELNENQIDKLLYLNDIYCPENSNKLLKLEQHSIFTVFSPFFTKHLNEVISGGQNKHLPKQTPTDKYLSSRESPPTTRTPYKRLKFDKQNSPLTRDFGIQESLHDLYLPKEKIVDDRIIVHEKHTRIATGLNNVSDEVCTTLNVMNNLHVGNSIEFGDFKISAITHSITVYESCSIELPANLKEIVIIASISKDINLTFTSINKYSIKNYRVFILNESRYIVYYNKVEFVGSQKMALHHFYVIYGAIYLGHKHVDSYVSYSYGDKLKLLDLKQTGIKPVVFSNWKSFILPDYCQTITLTTPSNFEKVHLDISIYNNFIIILDNSKEFHNSVSLNFIVDSDLDLFGEIMIINKQEYSVNIYYNESLLTIALKHSRKLISFSYHEKTIDIDNDSIVDVVNGEKCDITITVKNYGNSVKNNQTFWLVDKENFDTPLKPYEVSGKLEVFSNKFKSIDASDDEFTIKWLLDVKKNYILRNSHLNSFKETFLFKISNNIIPFRGEHDLIRNINGFYSMRPIDGAYIIDIEFSTSEFHIPKSISKKPIETNPSLSKNIINENNILCQRKFNSEKNILDPFLIDKNDFTFTNLGIYIKKDITKITFKNNIPIASLNDKYQAKLTYLSATSQTMYNEVYECKWDTNFKNARLYFNVFSSAQNSYINKIEIFNSNLVQIRFVFEDDSIMKLRPLLLNNLILDYENNKIIKNDVNFIEHIDKNITVDLCPGCLYELKLNSKKSSPNYIIFNSTDSKQTELWLKKIYILNNVYQSGNSVYIKENVLKFIPLHYNDNLDIFPKFIKVNDTELSILDFFTKDGEIYRNIKTYGLQNAPYFVSFKNEDDQCLIEVGDVFESNKISNKDSIIKNKINVDINIPYTLSFGTFEYAKNYFSPCEDSEGFKFEDNTISLNGYVSSIEIEDMYLSLYSSESNKFIFDIKNNTHPALSSKLGLAESSTFLTDNKITKLIGFAKRSKVLQFYKGTILVVNISLYTQICNQYFTNNVNHRIETTNAKSQIDPNFEFISEYYYFKKTVKVVNNKILDYNYSPGLANAQDYSCLVYRKNDDEYVISDIQYIDPSNSLNTVVFQNKISTTSFTYNDKTIHKDTFSTQYTLKVIDSPSIINNNLNGVLMYKTTYQSKNLFFTSFDHLIKSDGTSLMDQLFMQTSLEYNLFYYPGYKYINTNNIESIKYHSFPYDIDLFEHKIPSDQLKGVDNLPTFEFPDDLPRSESIFNNVSGAEMNSLELIFTDKAHTKVNTFKNVHKFNANIDDFRPKVSEGFQIIPRRIEYITTSNKNNTITITPPRVSDLLSMDNKKLLNFKITAPHFKTNWEINLGQYTLCITEHDLIHEFNFSEIELQSLENDENVVVLNLGNGFKYDTFEIQNLVQNMRNENVFIPDSVQLLIPRIDYDISTFVDPHFGKLYKFAMKNLKFSTVNTTIIPIVNLVQNIYLQPEDTIPVESPIVYNIQCLKTENEITIDVDKNFVFNDVSYGSIGGIGVSVGTYYFTFKNNTSLYPIGFVTDDEDLIEVKSGTLAGIEMVDSKFVTHYFSSVYNGIELPVTIEVKKNFGTISLHSLRNGYMGYKNRLHFVSECPAPLPALTLLSLENTVPLSDGYEKFMKIYKQSRTIQPINDGKYGLFEFSIQHKNGILNIKNIRILLLQARLLEFTGDYQEDYKFFNKYISERLYTEMTFINDYTNVNQIPKVFSSYTNNIAALYVSNTVLKIMIKVELIRNLYDDSINKIIPYLFVNYDRVPILLDKSFSDYHILNVNSNKVKYKVFNGSYMFDNNSFVQVDSTEWIWDNANSLIIPEGYVNSFYLLVENQGFKSIKFSINFAFSEMNGPEQIISLINNVAFTIKYIDQTTSDFNIHFPGDLTNDLRTQPTDGLFTFELKPRQTAALQYTILRLPDYIPSQHFSQYYKLMDVTDFDPELTALS